MGRTVEFVSSSDEDSTARPAAALAGADANHSSDWRPGRMGLGYTVEMHREKLKQEKQKTQLQHKLLGIKRHLIDLIDADLPSLATAVSDASNDSDGGKANITRKTVPSHVSAFDQPQKLSQSQKKRLRLKNKRTL